MLRETRTSAGRRRLAVAHCEALWLVHPGSTLTDTSVCRARVGAVVEGQWIIQGQAHSTCSINLTWMMRATPPSTQSFVVHLNLQHVFAKSIWQKYIRKKHIRKIVSSSVSSEDFLFTTWVFGQWSIWLGCVGPISSLDALPWLFQWSTKLPPPRPSIPLSPALCVLYPLLPICFHSPV